MKAINYNIITLVLKVIFPIVLALLVIGYTLLNISIDEKKEIMKQKIDISAKLISAVAIFDKKYSLEHDFNYSSSDASISQIDQAFKNVDYTSTQTNFILANRVDYKIIILTSTVDENMLYNDEAVKLSLDGKSGSLVYKDNNGKKIFALYQAIKGTSWGLVVKQSFSSFYNAFYYAALSMFVFIILLIIILYIYILLGEKKRLINENKYKTHIQLIIESTDNWYWEIDKFGIYRYCSKQIKDILGYEVYEVLGKSPFEFMDKKEATRVSDMFSEILESKKDIVNLENQNLTKDGKVKYFLTNGKPFYDENGEFLGYRGMDRDISQEKNDIEVINQLAYYDTLTSLQNRYMCVKTITDELLLCKKYKRKSALLFLDLDNFKIINDSMGHTHGDAVLKFLSKRIKKSIGDIAYISRFGGDEFVVLFHSSIDTTLHDLDKITSKLILDINKPFEIDSINHQIGVSVGIALMPDHGNSADELVKHADSAMYKAKEDGKNNYYYYKDEIQDEVNETINMKCDIQEAFENKEFELYYQTQYDVDGRFISGYEALVRWNHPKKGFLTSNQFLPYIVKLGLSKTLDRYIFLEALENAKTFFDIYKTPFRISINLSAISLEDELFISSIQELINENAIVMSAFTLEITESMLIKNTNYILNVINNLRYRGFKISIDDFGTGYSSLDYLSRFHFDELKIDKSFIDKILKSKKDRDICFFIVSLAKLLEVTVVAEGVEDENTLKVLKDWDVDVIQGYIYSKPSKFDLLDV